MNEKKYFLASSLICADVLNLEKEIKAMEEAGIDYIHFDAMDAHFVPRLGLYPEMLSAVKRASSLPVDVHLMMDNTEEYIPIFAKNGADIIFVPAEGNNNLHRTIKMIKDFGVNTGVAINPATPLNVLDYILPDLDYIMLMAINPGIVGHKLIPQVMEKISDLKAKLIDHPNILIEVDGGVTFVSAKEMVDRGANLLVCGSSSIYKLGASVKDNTSKLRQIIES